MASKKRTPAPKITTKSKSTPVSTPVRNTTLPPRKTAQAAAVATPKKTIAAPTFDQISARAYFNWQSSGGSQDDNWFRAERELRGL
jgi:hypothetical protein